MGRPRGVQVGGEGNDSPKTEGNNGKIDLTAYSHAGKLQIGDKGDPAPYLEPSLLSYPAERLIEISNEDGWETQRSLTGEHLGDLASLIPPGSPELK